MTADDLLHMTVKDLRALAERHGLSAPAKLRKDQLIGMLLPVVENVARPQPLPVPVQTPAGSSVHEAAPAPAPLHQGPDPGLPIPDQYGIDRLVLLVQDPHHVFAYWEVSAATYHRVAALAGEGNHPVLIIEGMHGEEQREIDLRGGNYYLSVGAGGTYRARLALRSRDGRLHALCGDSNVVATPAAGPSERHDEAWMEVDEHFHELLERAGTPASGESSLARFLKRSLAPREVALGEELEAAGGLMAAHGAGGRDSSAARLGRAAAGLSSHSLLSSHALAMGSLSSHSLSSHSLSSTAFSSHSRWTVQNPAFVQQSPGLVPSPTGASPAASAPASYHDEPAGVPALVPVGAAAVPAPTPIARPGQIKGEDTIKRVPSRRRSR